MTIFAWQFHSARPVWLAVLAALLLWIIFWRRSLERLSPGRRVVAVFVRTLLLFTVAVGLSGPTATGQHDAPVIVAKANPLPPAAPPPRIVLRSPDHVRAGEPFTVDVLVRSESSGMADLELTRDSRPLLREQMTSFRERTERASTRWLRSSLGLFMRPVFRAYQAYLTWRTARGACLLLWPPLQSTSIRRRGCYWWKAKHRWPSISKGADR